MLHDFQLAFRTLRRQLGFTAIAVATLALGIGANTAVFSVVHAVLLRPLPFDEPHELVAIWPEALVSKQEFAERRGWFRAYDDLFIWTRWGFTLTGHSEAEELDGVRASAALFRTLGVEAALGRTFASDEDQPGQDKVVVLSDGLWRRRFGADSSVIGQTITIGGTAHSIIGVMPSGFAFPTRDRELYVPLSFDPSDQNDYTAHYLGLVGRLGSGWTIPSADAELRTVIDRIRATERVPEDYGQTASLVPLRGRIVGDVGDALLLLWGGVGLVLVLSCVNVANLMLVRGTVQQRDLALRAALGGGRVRVARTVVSESLVLAALGGLGGGVLAVWLVETFMELIPPGIAMLGAVRVDPLVFGFVALAAGSSAVLFGLVPSIRLSAVELETVLREGSGGSLGRGRLRLQHALVVGEVALAVTLLVGAGLMLRSFWLLQRVDPGFQAEHALELRLAPPAAKYQGPVARWNYYDRVVDQLKAINGVEAVGGIVAPPLGDRNFAHRFEIDERPVPEEDRPSVNWRAVTPDYFRAMGIPLLSGRAFDARDRNDAAKVALVNETLARQYFGDGEALGQRVRTGFDGQSWVTIVGVVGDVHQSSLAEVTQPELYRPFAQWPWFDLTFVLRTTGDPVSLATEVRRAIWAIDRDVPISDMTSLEQKVSQSIAQPRFYTALLGSFALMGLVLGAVGLFGVLSFSVSRRTREIGLRMALGAARSEVLRMILRRGLGLTLLGVGLGLLSAYWIAGLMSGLLFGVSTHDPTTFAGVALVLTVTSIVASLIPARRATRIDPTEALRYE